MPKLGAGILICVPIIDLILLTVIFVVETIYALSWAMWPRHNSQPDPGNTQ